MPSPRLDDANIEYNFEPLEIIAAKVLDPLKIMWYQTRYAQLWKMKNSTPVPEALENDRSYFLRIAELDGKLGAIQEILMDHAEAIKSYNVGKVVGKGPEGPGKDDMIAIAHNASSLVHQT